MNILILNSNNPFKGAAVVSLDLFNEFKNKGHNVKLLVTSYSSDYPDGIVSMENRYSDILNRFRNKLKKFFEIRKRAVTDPNYHYHSINEKKIQFTTKSILRKANIKPDVILVLFAQNLITTQNIYEINKFTKAPVYWLMFDMAPLTGGCHYAWNCEGYQNQCGTCPGLYSSDPHDQSYKNFIYKKNYIDKTDIRIVVNSEWQHKQALISTLFRNKTIHKILISVDPIVFKPVEKTSLRLKLGIPLDKKVIFFGSLNLTHKRKGMQQLLDSLKILKEKVDKENSDLKDKIFLLIAGQGIESFTDSLPFDYHFLGRLDNTYGIASAYQASDVFICPSIEESGPTMINQSVMCGTPVVAFEMGVALDLVVNGETGYRVKLGDSLEMAQATFNLLKMNEVEHVAMSENCRKLAMETYHPNVIIENWINILNVSPENS
jgi:glycosyltransferase involved in cell wall biosynthesis